MPVFREGDEVKLPVAWYVPSPIQGRVGVVQGLALAPHYQAFSTDTNDEQFHDPEQVEDIYIVMFPELEMPYHVPESWMHLVRSEGEAELWSRRR